MTYPPNSEQVLKQKLENNDLDLINEWLRDAETSTPETTFRETALEDYEFYAGDQDTDEVLQALEDANRPASVYNEIKPKVDMLIGMAAEGRKMPDVLPVGPEDEPLAEMMKGTLVHFHKKLHHSRKELDAFDHTIKGGRSLIYFWVDKSNPFQPEIKSSRIDSWNFYLDSNSKEYDMSDARYLFIEKWVTEDEFTVLVPGVDPELLKIAEGGHYADEKPTYFNEERNRYRLVECWYHKPKLVYWFINPLTDQPESLTPEEYKKFVKLMMTEGIDLGGDELVTIEEEPQYTESFIKQYYYMIFIGDYKIAGGESPYTHLEGFPAVLYGAYKDEGSNTWFGAIKMMKDPQRAINTMNRQLSHLLQTLPKGILVHEAGSILNIDDYEENSANPNFHLEIARGAIDKVKFVQQPQISSIYQNQVIMMKGNMKDSSGVQDELMGRQQSSRDPVGTVRQRRETGMTVLYLLYDNYRLSRYYTAKKTMQLIQQFVTTPMMIRIEGEKGQYLSELNTKMNPQSQGFNDITAGKFDLEIDEAIETSTARIAIAEMLIEYSHNNPEAIPPDIVMEYMGLPFTVKQKIKQYHEHLMQMQMEQQQAELALQKEELDIKRIAAKSKNTASKSK